MWRVVVSTSIYVCRLAKSAIVIVVVVTYGCDKSLNEFFLFESVFLLQQSRLDQAQHNIRVQTCRFLSSLGSIRMPSGFQGTT